MIEKVEIAEALNIDVNDIEYDCSFSIEGCDEEYSSRPKKK